jgi:hypothetical protein
MRAAAKPASTARAPNGSRAGRTVDMGRGGGERRAVRRRALLRRPAPGSVNLRNNPGPQPALRVWTTSTRALRASAAAAEHPSVAAIAVVAPVAGEIYRRGGSCRGLAEAKPSPRLRSFEPRAWTHRLGSSSPPRPSAGSRLAQLGPVSRSHSAIEERTKRTRVRPAQRALQP